MLYTSEYKSEIERFINDNDLSEFREKRLLITGGTGLICSYLIDVLLATTQEFRITLLCSNIEKAKNRFSRYECDDRIEYIETDLAKEVLVHDDYDYILSAASFTDPKNYAAYPVETITTNVLGTHNLFEVAKAQRHLKRFFVFSSCEVYGEETSLLNEETKGIVDCLKVRSCYNESKRVVETMAISYWKEYNIPIIIGRFSRVYGPTMKMTDSKALSQFLLDGINKRDIVLKSSGIQKFSYCYVSDAVSAIIALLLRGEVGNAYNITNDGELLELREIAKIIAIRENVSVCFEIPKESEQVGYSTATIAMQDATKIKRIGWHPNVNLREGLSKTLEIIKQRAIKGD